MPRPKAREGRSDEDRGVEAIPGRVPAGRMIANQSTVSLRADTGWTYQLEKLVGLSLSDQSTNVALGIESRRTAAIIAFPQKTRQAIS